MCVCATNYANSAANAGRAVAVRRFFVGGLARGVGTPLPHTTRLFHPPFPHPPSTHKSMSRLKISPCPSPRNSRYSSGVTRD